MDDEYIEGFDDCLSEDDLKEFQHLYTPEAWGSAFGYISTDFMDAEWLFCEYIKWSNARGGKKEAPD